MLGVSHQFLITLLERGDIPDYMAETHRRVYVRDLLAYKAKRDSNRRKILDDLTRAEAEEGLYDLEPPDNRLKAG
ncbi:MAG: excisionase [Bryobacteraceae bacterium]